MFIDNAADPVTQQNTVTHAPFATESNEQLLLNLCGSLSALAPHTVRIVRPFGILESRNAALRLEAFHEEIVTRTTEPEIQTDGQDFLLDAVEIDK